MSDEQPTRHPNLASALAAFQRKLPRIGKGDRADTGTYSYSYANLADMSDVVLKMLADEGLSYTCRLVVNTGETAPPMLLRCTILHDTESVSSDWPMQLTAPQQMGSAMSYGRRYCLMGLTGVAPADEDDDGAAAQKEHERLAKDTVSMPASSKAKVTRSKGKPAGEDPWDEDPWADPPPAAGNQRTAEQSTAIFALLGKLGMAHDRDRAVALMSSLVGRHLDSSKELTKSDAAHVIDALKELAESPDSRNAVQVLVDAGMV